jgi:hypothetical protein
LSASGILHGFGGIALIQMEIIGRGLGPQAWVSDPLLDRMLGPAVCG